MKAGGQKVENKLFDSFILKKSPLKDIFWREGGGKEGERERKEEQGGETCNTLINK